MNRPSLKRLGPTFSLLGAIGISFCLHSCALQLDPKPADEKNVVVYVNLEAEMPAVAMPEATPTAQPSASPAVLEKIPRPIDPAEQSAQAEQVQMMLDQMLKGMESKGLLPEDIVKGASRLKGIRRQMSEKKFKAAEEQIRLFQGDLEALRIDETFITKKNARLLGLIQEKTPSPNKQKQIDRESEQINLLLEQSDYAAINRRLNQLFKLLEK